MQEASISNEEFWMLQMIQNVQKSEDLKYLNNRLSKTLFLSQMLSKTKKAVFIMCGEEEEYRMIHFRRPEYTHPVMLH
uniref:NR LBD domain-containing protein n=1 Tax=Caenorhabditis tropicalis TaxID=1561998 RepID=A0A1I7TYT5_9PELO